MKEASVSRVTWNPVAAVPSSIDFRRQPCSASVSISDRFEVCYEASCGYGHYHDTLNPIAARVTVAHPGRLRLIFRSKDKNDRKDAERLAKLLYLGEAPAVHAGQLHGAG